MKKITFLFPLLVVLAACEPVEPPAEDTSDACGASGYQGLIGQNRSALDGLTLPEGTRVIGPNDMVTADFRSTRLNIEYAPNGVIEKVSCF